MANNRPKHVVDYFRRGQVLFLVAGDEWDDQTSPQQVRDWAKPITDEKRVTLGTFRSVRFPTADELIEPDDQNPDTAEPPPPPDGEGPVIFLEKSDGKKAYTSPIVEEQGLFVLVSADVPELKDIPAEDDPARFDKLPQYASRLLNLIRSLDEIRGSFPVGTLQVVSPNWLCSSSKDSVPGGTGGPGARPSLVDETPANIAVTEYKINLHNVLEVFRQKAEEGNRGAGVVVAILDTAPKNEEGLAEGESQWIPQFANDPNSVLGKIYKKWVTDRSVNPPHNPPDPHPLISSLLNPADPRLTVYLNPTVDKRDDNIEPNGYIQADGHDYEMTDHGLFVAGIIHSIAPNAELHLYQVLNRYGVGDLVSIADALQAVYDRFGSGSLVVNLSLTINVPLVRQHSSDDDDDDMGRSLLTSREEEGDDENSWSSRKDLAAKRICDLAFAIGSRVIAAAGNNRKEQKQPGRPRACYPAALDSVLGVGALPKRSNPPTNPNAILNTSSYSNLSDRPNGTGIATLGGEPGKGKGILGIYLSEFPPREPADSEANNIMTPSKNGWGWWAGTSFATPIISGITAAVLSNLPNGSKTEDAIAELFGAQRLETQDNEDVLFVTQGPPPVSDSDSS